MYTLRFDGLLREVPGEYHRTFQAGFMCYGWLILRNGRVIARGHGVFGHGKEATSNAAEYLGLIEGLEALRDLGVRSDERIEVYGDAKSVIDQMIGLSGVNSPRTRRLYRQAHRLAREFTNLHWIWTPRRYNRDADQLTRRAMRQICSDQVHFQAAIDAIDRDWDRSDQFLSITDLRVYQPVPA
ncbi:MAG TPA: ribonuclease HI family protein [Anaerolineaceae bacterium]|nr:ribonuclease HI family protein [Anaerolineaceae bacterium]